AGGTEPGDMCRIMQLCLHAPALPDHIKLEDFPCNILNLRGLYCSWLPKASFGIQGALFMTGRERSSKDLSNCGDCRAENQPTTIRSLAKGLRLTSLGPLVFQGISATKNCSNQGDQDRQVDPGEPIAQTCVDCLLRPWRKRPDDGCAGMAAVFLGKDSATIVADCHLSLLRGASNRETALD